MEEPNQTGQLDESTFKLSDYGPLKIAVPQLPEVTEEDVDSQLLGYARSMGLDAGAVSDLTDEWARNAVGVESLAQLRPHIKAELVREARRAIDDLRLERCNDALAARVEGDIPDEILDAAVAGSRDHYLARLREAGTNKIQYMRENGLSEAQFGQMMRDDIRHQMLVNIALDKMAEANGITVSNSEITEYLACEDPQRFAAELEEKGRVEDARKVAVRVKMMRRLVEAVKIEAEGAGTVFATKEQARDAVIEG